jgi:hypothetical protein
VFPMMDELLGPVLERAFALLAATPETLLVADGDAAGATEGGGGGSGGGGGEDVHGEPLSPTEPDTPGWDGSSVGSPDTVSEADTPAGRTSGEMQRSDLRRAYLALLTSLLATPELCTVFFSPGKAWQAHCKGDYACARAHPC